ncbi:acyltransferase [Chryseobacterium sp. Alg-005]|uniref:acyltransferase family protein n=1 Tax=Chryseobacterium sp. Alg-005 TaxID=3159516 RepID=UPI0035558E52
MKLNNLQILRGISALLVCCFHFREYLNFPDLKLGDILFERGSIGVPVFFVISGFIMYFTSQKMTEDPCKDIISFFKKRIIRIVPLYYLLTFAWIVLGGSVMYYFKEEGLSRLIHSLLFLPEKGVFPVVYLGWSLNYEMFFYLVFGLFIFFKNKRYFLVITFFMATYCLGLVFKPENAYLQMVTSNLNLYFVVGIIFGLALNKIPLIPKNIALIISSVGILAFILMLFNVIHVNNLFLILIIVSLFVFSFLLFDYNFHFNGNRFLVFLGDISYSLYLSHPFVGILFKKLKFETSGNIFYFVLLIVVVILVAAILYYFVERKVTDFLRTKLNPI